MKIYYKNIQQRIDEIEKKYQIENKDGQIQGGEISIFVINAGVMHNGAFEDLKIEQIKETIDVNIY